jgi:hypothetical protein
MLQAPQFERLCESWCAVSASVSGVWAGAGSALSWSLGDSGGGPHSVPCMSSRVAAWSVDADADADSDAGVDLSLALDDVCAGSLCGGSAQGRGQGQGPPVQWTGLVCVALHPTYQVPAVYVKLCNDKGEPASARRLASILAASVSGNGAVVDARTEAAADVTEAAAGAALPLAAGGGAGGESGDDGEWIEDEIPCGGALGVGLCLHCCGVRERMALLVPLPPGAGLGAGLGAAAEPGADPLYLLKWFCAVGPYFGAKPSPSDYNTYSRLLCERFERTSSV